mgnify:CR=1 FL=1
MTADESKALVLERVAAGELLQKVVGSPYLQFISRATVARWCQSGKIPCIRAGKSFFSVNSAIIECLGKLDSPKPPKRNLSNANDAHEAALEALKRKGIIKNDFKPRQD